MKIKNIILCLVIITSLLGYSTKVIAEPIEITPDLPLEKQVELFTLVYGGNIETNKKVIKCESDWNVNAKGDLGRSNGIGQFQEESFNRLSGLMGEKLDYKSPHDQIKLLVWSIANGYGNEWTSYRAIKNGGTYTFYSKQLHRYFTIVCK